MAKLDGKVALVTGAARGLGRAYAKRLAGLGAKVAVVDLNLHSYQEFEAEAKDMTADSTVVEIEASGGTALGIEVDVRDQEAVGAMAGRVVKEWGRVDVLVANAGGGRGRPMDTKASTLDPALLKLVTEMNLFGTVYSCNAVAPIMKQQPVHEGRSAVTAGTPSRRSAACRDEQDAFLTSTGTTYINMVNGPRRLWDDSNDVVDRHSRTLCLRE
jgi:NAD(P)-dependent dehydrogenase (short-subunit alcohol dehydrogenase family)